MGVSNYQYMHCMCDGVARDWSGLQGTRNWMGSNAGVGTGDELDQRAGKSGDLGQGN
jgi:hypothetical protein